MKNSLSRRDFVRLSAAAAFAGPAAGASPVAVQQPQLLAEFDYADVRLTRGPLKSHFDRILASYLALDNDRLLKVYRERAGLPAPGVPMGGWYGADGFVPGHSLGQYISGLARFGRATGNSACTTKAMELADGFVATLGPSNRIYAASNAEKVWPCYVLDKHLAGLIDLYRLSAHAPAREALSRVYEGALPYIPITGRDRIGKKDPPYDEPYVLPENLFTAAEITGDRAMKERARAYLLDRDFFDPLARGEDVLPGRHAYSHVIALSSAAKAHLVLGDDSYLRAMKQAWRLLTSTQQFATGGWGPNETFITPHRGELHDSLSATLDHFETPCGSYAAIKLARYLLCATGDASYGDGLERILYNCILAVKDPDGDGDYPYYSTYSPAARKVYYPKKWPCCSGTLAQCVADYPKNIYFRTARGIAVNLYASSELSWNHGNLLVHLSQETDFPRTDTVQLRVDCPAPIDFELSLRMPAWLSGPAIVRIDGKQTHSEIRRGFMVLHRTWRSGDAISLQLPRQFRTESIDDRHPETVAMLLGPLVYVEANPLSDKSDLPDLEALRPDGASEFYQLSSPAGRHWSPVYTIQDERYTTYFTRT